MIFFYTNKVNTWKFCNKFLKKFSHLFFHFPVQIPKCSDHDSPNFEIFGAKSDHALRANSSYDRFSLEQKNVAHKFFDIELFLQNFVKI